MALSLSSSRSLGNFYLIQISCVLIERLFGMKELEIVVSILLINTNSGTELGYYSF